MKYFRHFSNASTSLKIQQILDSMGLEGYARYFLLLEILNDKFDGMNTSIRVHYNELAAQLRTRNAPTLARALVELASKDLIQYVEKDRVYEINCPMLLELMDRDSKYNNKKRVRYAKSTTLELDIELDTETDKELPLVEFMEGCNIVFRNYSTTEMYPRALFDEVAKEAYPIYLNKNDPSKKWDRFLSYYLMHNKNKIREKAIELSNQSIVDMSYSDLTKKLFSEAEDV